MSILGQKLQYMTEAYNDYSDPAYESYNADCGGSVLLEAESFDDMTDIIEACYKVDCKEISHLNNIMSLKESGASDSSIADAKSEYEYIHEADSKATGEGIGAKLKKIWEKVKNFVFSIGRKIRSLFEDTKKTYDRYKDRIKGKSVTLQGYEYELDGSNLKAIVDFVNSSDDELITFGRFAKEEDINMLTNKEYIYADLRGFKADQEVKPHDVTLSGDTIGEIIENTLTKDNLKKYTDIVTQRLNKVVETVDEQAKVAKGDKLASFQKISENLHKVIGGYNVTISENYKAIKEANSLYKKAILMMVSGKTGKKKEQSNKEENKETEKKEETTQESYYFWD